MIYYELIKIINDSLGLTKVILDVIVKYHGFFNLIMSDRGSIFISKFWSLLCYFFKTKQKLSITFHFQIRSQTKRQNNKMKAYFRDFINYKQNNWAKLLPIAEFTYNNAQNISIGCIFFELNYGYHSYIF